jgi:hypothetical protein
MTRSRTTCLIQPPRAAIHLRRQQAAMIRAERQETARQAIAIVRDMHHAVAPRDTVAEVIDWAADRLRAAFHHTTPSQKDRP